MGWIYDGLSFAGWRVHSFGRLIKISASPPLIFFCMGFYDPPPPPTIHKKVLQREEAINAAISQKKGGGEGEEGSCRYCRQKKLNNNATTIKRGKVFLAFLIWETQLVMLLSFLHQSWRQDQKLVVCVVCGKERGGCWQFEFLIATHAKARNRRRAETRGSWLGGILFSLCIYIFGPSAITQRGNK